MSEIATVEYFWDACEQRNILPNSLGLSDRHSKEPINLEWIVAAAKFVYQQVHGPEEQCTLLLAGEFDSNVSKQAVDRALTDSVADYLSGFSEACNSECNCETDFNCACVCASHCTCAANCNACQCTTCATCSGACNCNCNCTCTNCNCTGDYECNSNCDCNCEYASECQCDCSWECNCDQNNVNCAIIPAQPMTQNCGTACNCGTVCCNACACSNCQCTCTCQCECNCGW